MLFGMIAKQFQPNDAVHLSVRPSIIDRLSDVNILVNLGVLEFALQSGHTVFSGLLLWKIRFNCLSRLWQERHKLNV